MPDFHSLFTRLITQTSSLQFVYHLVEQRVLYVSEAYLHIIGDPITHVNDDLPYWLKRIHLDDWHYLRQRFTEAAPGEIVENVELRVARVNGGTQWLRLTAYRETGADGAPYLVGSLADITAAKEVSINADKFNTKKNATLEILSHDLAGPLALIEQLTQQLEVEAQGRLTGPMLELIGLVQKTCRDSVLLIRDFVDHEFMTSANVVLNKTRIDLRAWLGTLLEEYQRSQRHMNLLFIYTPSAEPVYALVDVNKFQQAINNLISNAIKFTPDGGRISVSLEQRGDQAEVRVVDTGVGIPSGQLPGLFERFTKARRPGLRGERSNGLGMSIIETIVHLHDGRIQVQSAENVGTACIIQLPALLK